MVDWLGNLVSDAVGKAFSSVGDAVWDRMLGWIFVQIFGALTDFFTMMNGMGAEVFGLEWVEGVVLLFNYFGWSSL